MLVSVVIPAYRAQETLVRAIESLRAQTYAQWECIIVADDMFDYRQWLDAQQLTDARIFHADTGTIGSGPHQARLTGLKTASGDIFASLDVDDTVAPQWLEKLVPVAAFHGAVTDNTLVIDGLTHQVLYKAFDFIPDPITLNLDAFFQTTAPLVPLVRRDKMTGCISNITLSEDVIKNAQLIDSLGKLCIFSESLYAYQVMPNSLSHHAEAAREYDKSYAIYIDRCVNGDGFGLSLAGRKIMAAGLIHKRKLNQLFAAAQKENPMLNFQTFVAARIDN
jgi:glycosyltransferase involved in cell wall biosynthesis